MKSQGYCSLAHYKKDNQKCLACNEDFIVLASNGYSEDQIEKQKCIIKFHTVAKASLETKISENAPRSYQSNIDHAQKKFDLLKSSPKTRCVIS